MLKMYSVFLEDSSKDISKSKTFKISCNTLVIIVEPPGEPVIKKAFYQEKQLLETLKKEESSWAQFYSPQIRLVRRHLHIRALMKSHPFHYSLKFQFQWELCLNHMPYLMCRYCLLRYPIYL